MANCNLKININNQAGVNLAAVQNQINSLLGSTASPEGNTVGANFVPSNQADYTLNIVTGFSFLPSGVSPFYVTSYVFAASIRSVFWFASTATINQIIGTTATHELTHQITGIPDQPYAGGPDGAPNLMQMNSYNDQYGTQLTDKLQNPLGIQLSPGQVSALYGACQQKRDQNHLGGGPGNSPVFGSYDMQLYLCLAYGGGVCVTIPKE